MLPQDAQTVPQQPGEPLHLSWSPPQGMIGLSFTNFFLQIITLGIYKFWGVTEVRKRIWQSVRLNGEPLTYTGTGGELFKGFLITTLVIFLPIFLLVLAVTLIFGPESVIANLVTLVIYVLLFGVFGYAVYSAYRYRLSRTNWRGIRGSLFGNVGNFSWTYVWTMMLIPCTFGWISPWRATKLQEIITGDTHFGSKALKFDGRSDELYPRFAVLWFSGLGIMILVGGLLAVFGAFAAMPELGEAGTKNAPGPKMPPVSFGLIAAIYGAFLIGFLLYTIVSAWYRSKVINHFAAHTTLGTARFKSTTTAKGLIWLAVSNFFIVVFTLGILGPVAQARVWKYMIENMKIEGDVPLAEIAQADPQKIRAAEGLAQAFGVDAL